MKGKRERTVALVLGVLLSSLVSIGGCKITVGGGGSTGNLNLSVPYVSQPEQLLCGVASVLMWRLYDGLSSIDQYQMASAMGCTLSTGCSREEIRDDVNFYTRTFNAVLDDIGGVGDPDQLRAEFHARQLQSLSMGYPVIAIIDGSTHAVVPNKGKYSTATDGLKRWDYVYVRDPWEDSGGPNEYYVAGSWMNAVMFQVVGATSMGGWQGSLSTHGNIYVRGLPGPPFCPDGSENSCA